MISKRFLETAGALVLLPGAAVVLALASALGTAEAVDPEPPVTVRWFGQACFELDFPTGLVVLIDPFDADKIGSYKFPKDVKPDVVTISHEHFDHNNDKAVSGKPEVLRGLTSADKDKADFQDHDVVRKGVRIRTVHSFHDAQQGAERGKNAIFVFEPETKGAFARIAHLGDLGHKLTDEEVKAIGDIDAVMIPVGGHFTVDAKGAKAVCDQLQIESAVFPMHYKTKALKPEIPLATAEDFFELFYKSQRQTIDGNGYDLVGWPPGRERRARTFKVIELGYEPKAAGKPDEVPDSSGQPGVSIGTAKAWLDAMPGPKKHELHVTVDVEAIGGVTGATVTVTATVKDAGKDVSIDLEDTAKGEAQPASGWTIEPGAKRTLKIAAKAGQDKGAKDGKVEIKATIVPKGHSGGNKTGTTATIQEAD